MMFTARFHCDHILYLAVRPQLQRANCVFDYTLMGIVNVLKFPAFWREGLNLMTGPDLMIYKKYFLYIYF